MTAMSTTRRFSSHAALAGNKNNLDAFFPSPFSPSFSLLISPFSFLDFFFGPGLAYLASAVPPNPRPCVVIPLVSRLPVSGADWRLQSDGVPDSLGFRQTSMLDYYLSGPDSGPLEKWNTGGVRGWRRWVGVGSHGRGRGRGHGGGWVVVGGGGGGFWWRVEHRGGYVDSDRITCVLVMVLLRACCPLACVRLGLQAPLLGAAARFLCHRHSVCADVTNAPVPCLLRVGPPPTACCAPRCCANGVLMRSDL